MPAPGLSLAALAGRGGRWPADAPAVVPGIAGPADADRPTLLRRIAQSQRIIERAARTIAGHETEPCPLRPSAGRPAALRRVAPSSPASTTSCISSSSHDAAIDAGRIVSPFRPDLVDCWIFRRRRRPGAEILLIRRAPGRILPGLWQCVSGSLEPGERVAAGALRELAEETGFAGADIEAFYDLDLVNQFHEPSVDGVVTAAVFAVRVAPDAEPRLSHEHDDARWLARRGPSRGRLAGLPDGHRADPRRPLRPGAGRLVRAHARRAAARRCRDATVAVAGVAGRLAISRQPTVRRHRRAT